MSAWNSRAVRRWSGDIWLLLQGTAAATLAWIIATHVGDHSNPFFAPIAAVVALGFTRGERGLSALQLLTGVGIGIVAGELIVFLLGGGYWSIALATFIAVVAARMMGQNRLLRNQAAAAAILTVAVADGHAGFHRLLDALIGAAVALLFTQVLFSPDPVALVRRAEAAAITSMSESLRLTAAVIGSRDGELDRVAADRLEDMGNQLSELGRALRASGRTARHSLLWRWQSWPAGRMREDSSHLGLLGFSSMMLIRTAISVRPSERVIVAPRMGELASVLADLALDLRAVDVRQRAVDRVHQLIRELDSAGAPADAAVARAVESVQTVGYDTMVFAGVDPRQAANAARVSVGDLRVIAPAGGRRLPFLSSLPIKPRRRRPGSGSQRQPPGA